MYSWPTSFPSDAITDAIDRVESGSILSDIRGFALDVENIQFWALGVGLPPGTDHGRPHLVTVDDIVLSDAQKTLLTRFGSKAVDAHVMLTKARADDNPRAPRKLGDGTLLQTILKWLPTVLEILRGIGVQVPPIPLPAPAAVSASKSSE